MKAEISRRKFLQGTVALSVIASSAAFSNELFKTSPFKVNIDSSHVQLTGIDFYMNPRYNMSSTNGLFSSKYILMKTVEPILAGTCR